MATLNEKWYPPSSTGFGPAIIIVVVVVVLVVVVVVVLVVVIVVVVVVVVVVLYSDKRCETGTVVFFLKIESRG
jgi:hypothetical protein